MECEYLSHLLPYVQLKAIGSDDNDDIEKFSSLGVADLLDIVLFNPKQTSICMPVTIDSI